MLGLLKEGVGEDIFDFHHQRVHYDNFRTLERIHSLNILGVNVHEMLILEITLTFTNKSLSLLVKNSVVKNSAMKKSVVKNRAMVRGVFYGIICHTLSYCKSF